MLNFILVNENFIKWLDKELKKRNWTRAELSRRSNYSQATMSLIYSGDRKPGYEFCSSIAHALNIPPEEIFSIAGILPDKSEESPLDKRIHYLINLLPTEEDKADVLAYIEMRHRLAEERGKNESRRTARPAKT